MDLISWAPKITARYARPNYIIEPAMRFIGDLRCRVCGRVEPIETSGHLLSADPKRLSMNIDWEFADLTKSRPCSECGTVSEVPKKDQKCIRTALSSITFE